MLCALSVFGFIDKGQRLSAIMVLLFQCVAGFQALISVFVFRRCSPNIKHQADDYCYPLKNYLLHQLSELEQACITNGSNT